MSANDIPPSVGDLAAAKPNPTPAFVRPTLGRIVHYRLPDGMRAGEYRAAIVTSSRGDDMCNLHVFLDGCNDAAREDHPAPSDHAYSAHFGDGNGQWIWPPRV